MRGGECTSGSTDGRQAGSRTNNSSCADGRGGCRRTDGCTCTYRG